MELVCLVLGLLGGLTVGFAFRAAARRERAATDARERVATAELDAAADAVAAVSQSARHNFRGVTSVVDALDAIVERMRTGGAS